jgi:hypothetical protein
MKISKLLCIGMAVIASADIAAADTIFSGTLCNTNNSNQSAGYNLFGIHNLSTSAAMGVDCSAAASAPVRSVSVTVYDRSPTDDVRCQIALVDAGGGVLFSAGVSSSGFATGPSTLTAAAPGISAGLVLECSVPAFNPQNGASHITTYSFR